MYRQWRGLGTEAKGLGIIFKLYDSKTKDIASFVSNKG
jgi:hypothetical protein